MKRAVFIAIGIIVLILGLAFAYYESTLACYTPAGTYVGQGCSYLVNKNVFETSGIAVAIIGLILLFIGILKKR